MIRYFKKPNDRMLSTVSISATIIASLLFIACGSSKKATTNYETIVLPPSVPAKTVDPGISTERQTQIKYAAFLKTSPDSLSNIKLYAFIDRWLNTPYKWGGIDEKGIDCSAFMQRLLQDVYQIHIPRTSVEQFFTRNVEPFHDGHYFSEGDLVFFSTIPGKPISHVGLYLKNKVFVNASSSNGVSLANLDDPYWKKRYVAAGRVKLTAN